MELSSAWLAVSMSPLSHNPGCSRSHDLKSPGVHLILEEFETSAFSDISMLGEDEIREQSPNVRQRKEMTPRCRPMSLAPTAF